MSQPTAHPLSCVPPAETSRWLTEEILPHEAEVRGYLQNHFPNLEADDVVQESYLKLLRMRATHRIASTRAYFFSVARNTALTMLRRRKIYSSVPVNELTGSLVIDGGRDAAEIVNSEQQLALVVGAIEQLPGRCREIVSLLALDGLSYAEIAARLRLSESTVRVQTARGIRKITAYLRELREAQ